MRYLLRILAFSVLCALIYTRCSAQTVTYAAPPGKQMSCGSQLLNANNAPAFILSACIGNVILTGSDGSAGYVLCCNVAGFVYTSPVPPNIDPESVCSQASMVFTSSGFKPSVSLHFACTTVISGGNSIPPFAMDVQATAGCVTQFVRVWRYWEYVTTCTVESLSLTITPVTQ